jgi:hypothetical protein
MAHPATTAPKELYNTNSACYLGKKLLNMIDEEIQATGRVSLDSNGAKIFDVTNFDYAPYDENDEDVEE